MKHLDYKTEFLVKDLVHEEIEYGVFLFKFLKRRLNNQVLEEIINSIYNNKEKDELFEKILTSEVYDKEEIIYHDLLEFIKQNSFLRMILPITDFILDDPKMWLKAKKLSPYKYIHIFYKKDINLYKALINILKNEGKFLFYDFILENRKRKCLKQISWNELKKLYKEINFEERHPSKFGQEYSNIIIDTNRISFTVDYCAWANYFKNIDNDLGYLVSCSSDEVFFKRLVPDIMFKRNGTIMDGSKKCDFCIEC